MWNLLFQSSHRLTRARRRRILNRKTRRTSNTINIHTITPAPTACIRRLDWMSHPAGRSITPRAALPRCSSGFVVKNFATKTQRICLILKKCTFLFVKAARRRACATAYRGEAGDWWRRGEWPEHHHHQGGFRVYGQLPLPTTTTSGAGASAATTALCIAHLAVLRLTHALVLPRSQRRCPRTLRWCHHGRVVLRRLLPCHQWSSPQMRQGLLAHQWVSLIFCWTHPAAIPLNSRVFICSNVLFLPCQSSRYIVCLFLLKCT